MQYNMEAKQFLCGITINSPTRHYFQSPNAFQILAIRSVQRRIDLIMRNFSSTVVICFLRIDAILPTQSSINELSRCLQEL